MKFSFLNSKNNSNINKTNNNKFKNLIKDKFINSKVKMKNIFANKNIFKKNNNDNVFTKPNREHKINFFSTLFHKKNQVINSNSNFNNQIAKKQSKFKNLFQSAQNKFSHKDHKNIDGNLNFNNQIDKKQSKFKNLFQSMQNRFLHRKHPNIIASESIIDNDISKTKNKKQKQNKLILKRKIRKLAKEYYLTHKDELKQKHFDKLEKDIVCFPEKGIMKPFYYYQNKVNYQLEAKLNFVKQMRNSESILKSLEKDIYLLDDHSDKRSESYNVLEDQNVKKITKEIKKKYSNAVSKFVDKTKTQNILAIFKKMNFLNKIDILKKNKFFILLWFFIFCIIIIVIVVLLIHFYH